MISITKLKISLNLSDEIIKHNLLSLPNTSVVNERIVAGVMTGYINSEESLLDACDQFEQLVNPASKAHVESFRIGTYNYVDTYLIPMYVYIHNYRLSCCLCACGLLFEMLHIGLQLRWESKRDVV